MPRTFFGVPLHQAVGRTLTVLTAASVLTAITQLTLAPPEEESTLFLHIRTDIILSLLGGFIGYTLQAHNPTTDWLFNRVYNDGFNILLRPFFPAGFFSEDAVDEINLIRDDIDGITAPPDNYRLR